MRFHRQPIAHAVARSGRIERALKQLAALKEKLRSPRTRYRQQVKVAAVTEILQACGAGDWILTGVQEQTEETFHQDHRGRPGKDTRYVKTVATRFDGFTRPGRSARRIVPIRNMGRGFLRPSRPQMSRSRIPDQENGHDMRHRDGDAPGHGCTACKTKYGSRLRQVHTLFTGHAVTNTRI